MCLGRVALEINCGVLTLDGVYQELQIRAEQTAFVGVRVEANAPFSLTPDSAI